MTIEDALGCLKVESFLVEHGETNLLLNAEIQDNGCGNGCNGRITLEVDALVPASYNHIHWADGNFWQPLERRFLCPGNYHVTITLDGCEEEHTFTVGQMAGGDLDFEYIVTRYFGNEMDIYPLGSAGVKFYSNQFQYPGTIEIDVNPPLGNTCNNGTVGIAIPIGHKDIDPFYFTYTVKAP